MAFLPLVAAGVSLLGAGASALAESKAAGFQSRLAAQQSDQVSAQAAVKASQIARSSKQQVSALRAGALQNGFELTGSMSDLVHQAERQGPLDYMTAVYDGTVQARGLTATSEMYRRQKSSALIGGLLGAGGKALGGVADRYKNQGADIAVNGTYNSAKGL